ncbi:hypothetical protein R1flu_014961 [Riccia fluitans]|uniref:non-specific serine/threonine protein kinase n=1 Tax=Riccia fluitans TaxID=41844 RepID=A0ABD1YHX5_9MARC
MTGPRSLSIMSVGILLCQLLCMFSDVDGQSNRRPDVSFEYSSFDDTAASSLLLAGDVNFPTNTKDGTADYVVLVAGGEPWIPEEGIQVSAGRILQNLGISMVNKSFSTQFTFSMERLVYDFGVDGADGLAFVLVSNPNAGVSDFPGTFGVFDGYDNGHDVVLAVEFDTFRNPNFNDMEEPHVGVDLFSVRSVEAKEVSPICLNCGMAITVWIDYSNWNQLLEIRITNSSISSSVPAKPKDSFLHHDVDLSTVVSPVMWAGFGASTSNFPNSTQSHNIHRWSFQTYNESSPPGAMNMRQSDLSLRLGVGLGVGAAVLAICAGLGWTIWRCRVRKRPGSSNHQVDDGVLQLVDGPHKFKYRELSRITDNFSEECKLGEGGFGNVYRGVLRDSGTEIAVKFMGRDSKQGLKEFLAEVSIISRLRHRNLVQLLGYCTDHGKFLLAYDYMPRGSLDKHLFNKGEILSWSRRFNIIKGVAAALDYLHEGWQQQVIHRDVKPSNVMLDKDYTAKLGDFGLARLREHQIVPQTTRIAGTWGYIAPELVYTGKATNKTDVYSFGAMILEIASGKPVVDRSASDTESVLLVDIIWDCRRRGNILEAADQRLGGEYVRHEMETVLLMGLLCSHPEPEQRPTMRQLLHIFNGDSQLPHVPMARPIQTYAPVAMMEDFPIQSTSMESLNSSLFGSSTTMDSSSRATPVCHHIQSPRGCDSDRSTIQLRCLRCQNEFVNILKIWVPNCFSVSSLLDSNLLRELSTRLLKGDLKLTFGLLRRVVTSTY